MSINQRVIRNNRFATLAEIKAVANANEKTICYCDETDRSYRYVIAGSGYTANDDTILITGAGGDTRWVSGGVNADTVSMVASGAISTGDLVIINPDGTVSSVVISGASNLAFGTPVTYRSGTNYYSAIGYDANEEKIVVAFCGASYYGYCAVGSVSGDAVTFGTPVAFNSAVTSWCSVCFDSLNNKIVVSYSDESNSNYGTAVVGTVSGTSISFGTPVVFESANTASTSAAFSNGKIIISYRDVGNSGYGTAIVGTVSGTSISFGTPVVFESASTTATSIATVENDRVVVSYTDVGNSGYGTAVVGTVSGTSISFGTPVVFESANTTYTTIIFDALNGKVVVSYTDAGNSNYGTAVVGTVSGTSISFGTPVVFEAAATSYVVSTYDTVVGKICIAYRDEGNSNYLTAVVGTVSGTSISFQTPVVANSSASAYLGAIFDASAKSMVVVNAAHATASIALGGSNVSQTNFLGISQTACTDSESCVIGVSGFIDKNQSGLTPGVTYYIADDSAVLSSSGSGIIVGKAIATTEILISTDNRTTLMISNINPPSSLSINLGTDAGDSLLVGTNKLVVKGSSGNVGVGVEPLAKLHVNGNIWRTGSDFVYGSIGTVVTIYLGSETGNFYGAIGALTTGGTVWGNLVLQLGGGKVGIGTSTPANGKLVVLQSSDAANQGISIEDATGAARSLRLWINGTDSRIDSGATGAGNLIINAGGGNVGIGTAAPNQKLTVGGSISLVDQEAAASDTAGYGQLWASNATPDELWFTDDAGTDTQISSHPMDAPAELYTNGPGLDWIGVKRHKLLGVIQWQTMDGAITEETFEAYNSRRKDVPGHQDLIQTNYTKWLDKRKENFKKRWIEENTAEVETIIDDIKEAYQEDEELKDEILSTTTITETEYKFNPKTGVVDGKVSMKEKPVYKTRRVTKYRLKENCRIDEKTGKTYKNIAPSIDEVNMAAKTEFSPGLPAWMQTRINKLNLEKV